MTDVFNSILYCFIVGESEPERIEETTHGRTRDRKRRRGRSRTPRININATYDGKYACLDTRIDPSINSNTFLSAHPNKTNKKKDSRKKRSGRNRTRTRFPKSKPTILQGTGLLRRIQPKSRKNLMHKEKKVVSCSIDPTKRKLEEEKQPKTRMQRSLKNGKEHLQPNNIEVPKMRQNSMFRKKYTLRKNSKQVGIQKGNHIDTNIRSARDSSVSTKSTDSSIDTQTHPLLEETSVEITIESYRKTTTPRLLRDLS